MRLLEYRLDLTNHGYTVIGGDMHYEALVERKCQPIRMTNLVSGSPANHVENLIHAVDKDWGEEENADFFYANYADILRGKYPEWQIISFRIIVGYICLNFYNFKTEKTGYLGLNAELSDALDVQFDLPGAYGGPDARYLVSFDHSNGGKRRTRVIEFSEYARREIDFFFKNPEKTDPFSDEQYVEIAEYANL